ncbi:hypothetical protein AGABI2DRAFT_189413 [Agaricus bisporus var. bisporus H97]|uniref:hypothetical protein n=1 Tax=Agaricus bisporus var. bisporus (strain H97 / ATCC MYA-4626 / FGSC 10389) TaxID=936046 RepID=UPI00029F7C99|nr:hypothetical protein AGABI2DRAFT_189413 [Agaricus bisporus var. bisporus H97]EKV51122.1 hypothetical protein AGABI2DRAFT_189413 [Agaricus bisporus var. bisporus H97]
MPTHFKLKFDSLTRRATFAHHPSWGQLSAKVASLFSIPQHQVAVTYVDAEDEEITLSTEEELQDYYQSSLPGDSFKLSVRDLSRRNQSPEQPALRNTFGQFPDLDIPGLSEWHSVNNVPSLEEILGHTSEVRSAYLETVPSEASKVPEDNGSEISEQFIPTQDKGKGIARSHSSMSSTRSLLAEDAGDKYPVHVYDVSGHQPSSDPYAFESGPAAAQSTPRVSASLLDQIDATPKNKSLDVDDPPLPSFDFSPSAEPSAQTSASLARDVASFLNIFSNIVSSHPEIGDSLRTIARNTTNGTYWAAHRDAISQAASEFQRNTGNMAEEGRRMAETEAGRRIAEALSSVLSIFSQAPQATTTSDTKNAAAAPPDEPTPQSAESMIPTDTPSMPGAFSSADFDSRFGGPFPFPGRRWTAGASMPPNSALRGGNPPPWAWQPHLGSHVNATGDDGPSSHFTNAFAPVASADTAPKPKPEMSVDHEENERPSPQDLKAKVEEAKRAYKAEKERYRKDRDERRKGKEQSTANDLTTAESIPEIAQIASNARHDFPRFDIVNVTGSTPQRHNSHPGHTPRLPERPSEDLFTRAVNRISRRLADMGFTEISHPDLSEKIRNYLPADGAIARESEDDIVTSLLEAMLTAPRSPVASGSSEVPGGWA